MNINKDNYLAFFLDYHEGNLSAADKQLVERFLVLHPELREEFEAFDTNMSLNTDNIHLHDFSSLKRTENGVSPYNQEIIAYVEGDLDRNAEKVFEKKIETNALLEKDLRLFQLSKLPLESIVFADKDALKRQSIIRQLVPYVSVAAAACFTVLVGYYFTKSFVGESNRPVAITKSAVYTSKLKPTAVSIADNKRIVAETSAKKQTTKSEKKYLQKLSVKHVELFQVKSAAVELFTVETPKIILNTLASVDIQAEKQAATSLSFTEFAQHYIEKRLPSGKAKEAAQENEHKGFFAYAINTLAAMTGGNFGMKSKQDSLKQTKHLTFFAGNIEFSRTSRK